MSAPGFLFVPEWQGSPSSRAMRLVDGAAALREDLPASALREVAVPLEAGDSLGTPALRLGSVLRTRESASDLLRAAERTMITVGGDCAAGLAGLADAVRRTGPDRLAVLWLDAHADAQHPSTSPTGAISGMVLRAALGDSIPELQFDPALHAQRVVLLGVRDTDPEEEFFLSEQGISRIPFAGIPPEDLAAAVRTALSASGADHVYVHLDLDVIDPAEMEAVHNPVPFGLSLAQALAAVRSAVSTLPLAGAAICEFAPASAEQAAEALPTVLRVLAALTSGERA